MFCGGGEASPTTVRLDGNNAIIVSAEVCCYVIRRDVVVMAWFVSKQEFLYTLRNARERLCGKLFVADLDALVGWLAAWDAFYPIYHGCGVFVFYAVMAFYVGHVFQFFFLCVPSHFRKNKKTGAVNTVATFVLLRAREYFLFGLCLRQKCFALEDLGTCTARDSSRKGSLRIVACRARRRQGDLQRNI